MRDRLSRLAPEEIAGGVFLVVALLAVALQPAAIGRIFESPYATPAPESGAAAFVKTAPMDTTFASDRVVTRSEPLVGRPGVFLGSGPTSVRPDRPLSDLGPDPCEEAARSALRSAGAYVVCVPSAPIQVGPRQGPPILIAPPSR
jgi:hypothetical protein